LRLTRQVGVIERRRRFALLLRKTDKRDPISATEQRCHAVAPSHRARLLLSHDVEAAPGDRSLFWGGPPVA